MPKLPPNKIPRNAIRFGLGALLTVQEFGKMWLAGRKEPRMCPRCAYKMVQPNGRRYAGKDKPWRHKWHCEGCRAQYESDGAQGPFRTPPTQS